MAQYFLINKPFGMLSQFTREADHHRVLGDLYPFPKNVYPVGRLDRDSEGLLILTDDTSLNAQLLRPEKEHPRTYWVQVEGNPTPQAIKQLEGGVVIKLKKKTWQCAKTEVSALPDEISSTIPPRQPPVRFRKTVPDSWWSIKLTEGKNRQVRKMWAKVGYPVLRLLRFSIEDVTLNDLEGESVVAVQREWLFPNLNLKLP
jgi:23S rRNA pseudouridine2457 synthase